MQQDALVTLETELRAAPPAGLERLDAGDLLDLAGAVRQARARQAAELAAAGDNALKFVPRLLRGPLRKVVGG